MVRAIAFDVDGTIADTDPVHAAAWSRALHTVTGRVFIVEDYLAACVEGALSPRAFVRQFAGADDLATVEEEKRRIYPDMLRHGASLTLGLARLLADADAAGVRTMIVSSSSRESVDAMLDTLWTAAPPVVVVARGDAQAEKPAPAPYLVALDRAHFEPFEVVAFEDSASGVSSALAAGLVCLQVGGLPGGQATRIDNFTHCSISAAGSTRWLVVKDH